MMVPGRHNLSHIAITCTLPLASWPGDPRLQLAKSLAGELVTWQSCQLWPQLPNLNQVSNADLVISRESHGRQLCCKGYL